MAPRRQRLDPGRRAPARRCRTSLSAAPRRAPRRPGGPRCRRRPGRPTPGAARPPARRRSAATWRSCAAWTARATSGPAVSRPRPARSCAAGPRPSAGKRRQRPASSVPCAGGASRPGAPGVGAARRGGDGVEVLDDQVPPGGPRAVSSRCSRSAIVRSIMAWWERAAARRCSAARTSPLGAPSPAARATTEEVRPGRLQRLGGWAASVALSRSAAAAEPVTRRTDWPRLTASAATAAAVVVFPAPGGRWRR